MTSMTIVCTYVNSIVLVVEISKKYVTTAVMPQSSVNEPFKLVNVQLVIVKSHVVLSLGENSLSSSNP